MIVQEAGIAVGWPLGLGHDTTGWPLGLRLRLTQEDLQWPREPGLTRSPSNTSEDSSSLDTMSTESFFQDRSISLGALIGLPLMDYNANRQRHRPAVFPSTIPSASVSSSSSSQCSSSGGSSTRSHRRQNGTSSTKPPRSPNSLHRSSRRGGASPRSSTTPGSASSTGWNLLSALSCARVPADIGIPLPRPQAQAAGDINQDKKLSAGSSRVQAAKFAVLDSEQKSRLSPVVSKSNLQSLSSPGRKLYDNITFEEDDEINSNGSDQDGSQSSKEWNPLFASSSMLNDDEEDDLDDDQRSQKGLEVLPESLRETTPMRSTSSAYSDAHSRSVGWTSSGSDNSSLDVRKYDSNRPVTSQSSHRKNALIFAFVSRMVCCRSTPTRGSSI